MGFLKDLKTFNIGDSRCDWCGSYIKNTDGGLIGMMGGDIIKRAVAAGTHHFCDSNCKKAWEEEHVDLASTKAKNYVAGQVKKSNGTCS